MQKITPFLWFDNQAEEAAKFYTSIFKKSKITATTHYTGEEPVGKKGSVMTVSFELDGEEFVALNGGPRFKFTEAVSFVVNCETQEEVDYFWKALTADGGEESRCGWLTDRFRLSWQIVPRIAIELLMDKDAAKARRVTKAIMEMSKINIAELKRAARG
ncbi:MAG TPA: VOC family protein [Candidatus Udaeobacter sp.]|nr:VOC family protein [Candidatus Udaeobacter sp.]